MARPGIMLYFDFLEPIMVLSDEEKGRLLMAMLEYGKDGILPEFTGMLALAWGFVKPKIDRDEESYENSKAQRKYAAFCKKRANMNLPKISFDEWKLKFDNEAQRAVNPVNEAQRAVGVRYPSTSTTPTTSTSTTAATTTTDSALPVCDFSPPSVEAVREYCNEHGYSISPERFVQYYTERGWMVGKDPMTDWQAVVRRWEETERQQGSPASNVDPMILKAIERLKARNADQATEET